MKAVTPIAVTMHNFEAYAPRIAAALATSPLTGLDIETAQPRAHAGIKAYNVAKRLAFDIKRTDLCGISLWPKDAPEAYYLNVGHADVDGRIPWPRISALLSAKPKEAKWVCHNAQFERTMLQECVGWVMEDYICTMQMAVSAYGPDEFDQETFEDRDLGDIEALMPEIRRVSRGRKDSSALQKTLSKIIAKESVAAHSYNGYVHQMRYGYGLKGAVQAFFGYQMATYAKTLKGYTHMGELTTEDTAPYGCDDAIWAVRLFDRLLKFMLDTNPAVVGTYFQQELPMIETYSAIWRDGVRINHQAVIDKQLELRVQFGDAAAELKAAVAKLLPFPVGPNEELWEREPWYAKSYDTYRARVEAWATSPNSPDPFTQCVQLGGAIPKAWAEERGVPFIKQLNITHYMVARTIMYDLLRRDKPLLAMGKVQSDADARGNLREVLIEEGKTDQARVMELMGKLGTVEQAEKLYISPYLKLVDPNTSRMYPIVNSLLATRRMAMSTPNATQLAKYGESSYVRGFFQADHDDHVIVSIDWSQIELVLFGEFSGDPMLARCYSKIPYDDVHMIATAACLGVSEAEILRLKAGDPNVSPHLLVNPKGEALPPAKAYGYWRTQVGKGSNFEFIYSGLLWNLGNTLGWTKEMMFEVTGAYATKFARASNWRQELISDCSIYSKVSLPDGHTRVRFEATPTWANLFRDKWRRHGTPEVMWFAEQVIRRIQTRAGNQAINAKIQGTSATLTKRSLAGIRAKLAELNWSSRDARIMFPVHDEIVASVHRDKVVDYIKMARGIMMHHPDIVKTLLIDCTPSVGLTYQPWHAKSAPMGQIELFEAPDIACVPRDLVGQRLPETLWPKIVEHLYDHRS